MKKQIKHPLTRAYFRNMRKTLGLTQTKMAELLDKKRDDIANYEAGRASPIAEIVLHLQGFTPDSPTAIETGSAQGPGK